MADPIDYGAGFRALPNPMETFVRNVSMGNGQIANMQKAITDKQAAEQAARLAQEKAQMEADRQAKIEEARQKVIQPNASAEDRVNYLSLISPEQANAMRAAIDQQDKTVASNSAIGAGRVVASIKNGKLDFAKQQLQDRATALRNENNEDSAKFIESVLIPGLDVSPEMVAGTLQDQIAFAPNGKEITESINAIATKNRAETSLPHDINLTDAKAAEA